VSHADVMLYVLLAAKAEAKKKADEAEVKRKADEVSESLRSFRCA
jgi:hypothetical protein